MAHLKSLCVLAKKESFQVHIQLTLFTRIFLNVYVLLLSFWYLKHFFLIYNNVFAPFGASGKVQMLQTRGQNPVPTVSAVGAVSRGPGAFVFDVVT